MNDNELYTLQIALFFSTNFNQDDKLRMAEKVVINSNGLFTPKDVSYPQVLNYISGPPWLTISNPNNGYNFHMSDDKVDIIWVKSGENDTITEEDFISKIGFLLEPSVYDKDKIRRLGFVRTFLITKKIAAIKKLVFTGLVIKNFQSLQANLVAVKNNKPLGDKLNIRMQISTAKYSTPIDPQQKDAINLQVDINSLETKDINLPVSDVKDLVSSIGDEFTYDVLIKMLG